MKCPQCVAEGERSQLFPGTFTSTSMNASEFYDEDGAHHRHDRNLVSRSWSCSRGHRWSVREPQRPCPTAGCSFNDQPAAGVESTQEKQS